MATVSIVMMVKNEERLLPQCLDSVKWADEIVVVDTGSTDNTMEIAKSYGAIVHEHPWQNDFSLHRNQSISYATCDWLMILDADEVVASDMTKFKQRLDMIPPHVGALVVREYEIEGGDKGTSWLSVRFFRKSSGIRYKGIVHNKAKYEGMCAATDVELHHFGYNLDKDKMQAKRDRTEALLMSRLDENENDHAALYYMTQLRIGQKRYAEAEEFGIRFFKCVPVHPTEFQFYSVMYFFMAWAALHLNDGDKACAWAIKGLEFYPDDLDLNYIMARVGYQSKNDGWLATYGAKYLEMVEFIKNENKASNEFEQPLDPAFWANRTIYTVTAEPHVRKFMESL